MRPRVRLAQLALYRAAPAPRMNKHLPILDLARAGAACWVMIAHLTLIGGRSVFVVSQGSLGVEVFIFISGFLMTMILKDEPRVSGASVRQFYIRRFFRIAPSFYLALALYVVLRPFFTSGLASAESLFATPYHIAGLQDPVTVRSVLLNLLFAHGIFPAEAGRVFGPAWSLSLEMQFYLVAPVCIWCFRRWPIATLAVLFATNYVANLLFGVYGRHGVIATFTYPSLLPNRIFLFLFGASYCLYLFGQRRKDLVILLASAVALLPTVGFKSWLVSLLLVLFIHGVVSSTGSWRKCWAWIAVAKPTQLLAEWSYGIYLYHMLCMAFAGHVISYIAGAAPAVLLWLSYAAITISSAVGLSALLHYTVERPARDFGKRLARIPRPVRNPAAAAR
jgi:peptidoglycan/LPS O-acetylase OafA/YrhL